MLLLLNHVIPGAPSVANLTMQRANSTSKSHRSQPTFPARSCCAV